MKKSRGFTLIELMIVVGIVAILASVSFNFYADYVRKANRTEARSELSNLAGQLEKCRSLYGSYLNAAGCSVAVSGTTDGGKYTLSSPTRTATSFVLTATATGAQADDTDCSSLSLSNTGLRTATGADTTVCW